MSPSWIITAVTAALLLLVALGFGVWRTLRRRKLRRQAPKRAPRLRYPVVLAHGILGFDQVKVGPLNRAYFHGIEPRLTQLGTKVYAFRVRPTASVAQRAQDLARAVESLDAERVNVIAHSMGGLDARYLASKLGMAARIASITTVGTPHRGTPLADLGTGLWGVAPTAKALLQKMGVDVEGFFDLTTARMTAFNLQVPDAAGVFYGSWTARAAPLDVGVHPLLLPTWKLIQSRAGENDGLVPVASQAWGEVLGTIDADHWAQIGWSASFDAPAFYERLVRDLIERDF